MAIVAVYPLVNNATGEYEEPVDWRTGGLVGGGFYPQKSGAWPTSSLNTGLEWDATEAYLVLKTDGTKLSFQIGSSEYAAVSSTGLSVTGLTTTLGVRLNSQTTPASPVNGDMWSDGTSIFYRAGGTTRDLSAGNVSVASTGSAGIVKLFTAAEDGANPYVASVDSSGHGKFNGIESAVADSAVAVGVSLNTPAYTTTGAKLVSFQNNSVEKAYVDKDGKIVTPYIYTNTIQGRDNQHTYISFNYNSMVIVGCTSPAISMTVGNTGWVFSTGSKVGIGITPTAGLHVNTWVSASAGGVPDNASAVSAIIDTTAALTVSGAKLLSLRNATAEKAYIDKDGSIVSSKYLIANTGYGFQIANFQNGINPMWSFAAYPAWGMSYYAAQGDPLGIGVDAIGFHFGNASAPTFYFKETGALVSSSTVSAISYGPKMATSAILQGAVADGATAVGTVLNNTVTLATTGAKLLSARNNGTEKAYIAYDGEIYTGSNKHWHAGNLALGVANGVATLDASGLINTSQLPPLSITDTFVAADQTAMLALTAQVGDVAVRTDLSKSFILKTAGASTLANWQELLTPADAVSSVAGRTGAVTLAVADISGAAPLASPTFTGTVTGTFSGNLSGNATTATSATSATSATTATSATSATSATTATNATNVAVTDDTTTNAAHYLAFVNATSGNVPVEISSTKLTYNPSTGILTAQKYYSPGGASPTYAFSASGSSGLGISGDVYLIAEGSSGISFGTTGYGYSAANTKLRIDNSGSIGFGTNNPGASLHLVSKITDGASAIATLLDTSTAWSTTGAKLLSLRNNATEKLAVTKDGDLNFAVSGINVVNSTTTGGTLSFEGSAGPLFAITNDLGTLNTSIFSVNDVTGIPSIEVLSTGEVKLAQYNGKVGVATATPLSTMHVGGVLTIGTAASASAAGNVQFTNTGGSPIKNRLEFGATGGWGFAISSNVGGTITDLISIDSVAPAVTLVNPSFNGINFSNASPNRNVVYGAGGWAMQFLPLTGSSSPTLTLKYAGTGAGDAYFGANLGVGTAPSGILHARGAGKFLFESTSDQGANDVFAVYSFNGSNKCFGVSNPTGQANAGQLTGISTISGLSRISLSAGTLGSSAAINIASSNMTLGCDTTASKSLVHSYTYPLAFNVGGGSFDNERMRIAATGEVGVGTTAPGSGFDVHSITADGATAVAVALDTQTAYSTAGAKLLSVRNNAVEKMYVDKDGNVTANSFIGTVTTATNATNTTITDDTSTNATHYLTFVNATSGNLAQEISSTKLVFNPSTGNVGIGTASPGGALDVLSASYPVIRATRTTADTNSLRGTMVLRHQTSADMADGFGAQFAFQIQDSAGVENDIGGFACQRDGADNSGKLSFQTFASGAQSTKMVIAANGNVGIGQTAPGTLGMFEMQRDQNAATSMWVGNATDGTAAQAGFQAGQTGPKSIFFTYVHPSNTFTAWQNRGVFGACSGTAGFVLSAYTSNQTIDFQTGGSGVGNVRMRIESGGNIAIGKTSAAASMLDVNGTVTATAFSGPLTGNVTGTASAAPWSGITSKPTTLSGYGITDAVNTSALGANSGVATLDSSGKLTATQIPSISIINTSVVANQAARLALTADVGDVAVQTDTGKTYILATAGASTNGNWTELLTTGAVSSVAGRTGAVTLAVADVSGAAPTASPTFSGSVGIGVSSSVPLYVYKATGYAQDLLRVDAGSSHELDFGCVNGGSWGYYINARGNASAYNVTGYPILMQPWGAAGVSIGNIAPAAKLHVTSQTADGATAVATIIDTSTAWSTSGAKLLSVRNNGTEKAYINYTGAGVFAGQCQFNGGAWLPQGINIQFGSSIIQETGTAALYLGPGVGDSATAIGTIIDNRSTLTTTGAKLLSIRNNTAEKAFFTKDGSLGLPTGTVSADTFGAYGTSVVTLQGWAADGATAVGVVLNAGTALTVAGAKIASFRNAGVEKASIDKDGTARFSANVMVASGQTVFTDKIAVSTAAGLSLMGFTASGSGLASVILGNEQTLSGASDKLVSCRNNSVEKAYVDKDGNFYTGANKVWTAGDFAISNYATLNAPTFTGVPAAPTAAADTNTTQLATTAFVVGQASTTNPAMDGTAAYGSSLKYARQDHVHPTDTSRAALVSPSFTTPNIGAATGTSLTLTGTLTAATKSFAIPHPMDERLTLTHGSLEGPENGVYHRGRLQFHSLIVLPEYWLKLVDPKSITVSLTPVGAGQKLYVDHIDQNIIYVGSETTKLIDCFYTVYGERVDVPKLVVESPRGN